MPHRSRDRHRGYEPEWERRREIDRRRYRDDRGDDGSEDDDDDDEDNVIDSEEAQFVQPDRRRRRHHGESRSRSNRRYDPYDRHDEGGIDNEYDDRHDDDEESEIIVVDSRPNFARPPNVRPSPRRISPSPYVGGRERSRHHKAKESPATSPIKKRHRDVDREGQRRRRDSTADEGAMKPKLRERGVKDKHRERDKVDPRARSKDEHKRSRHREQERERVRDKHTSSGSANSATQLLSADALSKLNANNAKRDAIVRQREAKEEKARHEKEKRRRKKEERLTEKSRHRDASRERGRAKGKKRVVSGAMMEEGRGPELRVRGGGGRVREKRREGDGDGGGGGGDGGGAWFRNWSKKKKIWVVVGILILLLIIFVPVGLVVSKKKDGGSDSTGKKVSDPSNDNLKNIDRNSIPQSAKGTYLDPFSWYDTTDFNVTFTDETVGGLPIMGLNSTWDDSVQANEQVPPLDKEFPYGKKPIRGVNVGGWLSIEPFITPSFFSKYSVHENVVDEYTLTKRLGSTAKAVLEKHYATFITEQSFREIRDAGLDHVRIPYSYWAVKTFDDDPYVEKVSWRYLLRAIEYCRKYGLRVNLDLHALPGSQNGWNHSGRQGPIGWLNGTDGNKNAQRALDIHDQLSKFFAQPRYKNVVTIYGLANEPLMLKLDIEPVLDWTTKAAETVEKNGMKQYLVFGDGFLKLSKWTTILQNTGHKFILDTHQYTIFNTDLIGLPHKKKLEFVCDGWVQLIGDSNSKGTGWGPTICGEWSQADTDCAKYLNNVNVGTRWTGTMDSPTAKDQVFSPLCPTTNNKKACSCDGANANPSAYSDSYKKFLQTYAEAQMFAFEKGWGWFYWTWETESATQWSWRRGLEAGILPKKAYEPTFTCGAQMPDLGDLPEYY
ncbi:glucan 1,3-beta-glucosidase [Emydomyces testavorans]|uniref:glucan 1,3-beta-glucosidase n=1 Tax=Emydomyces testavorans TaxID=2070801 RepID=A0AAF0DGC0_9EURO|nr:glucan 1,3-beta-glucosidase [Emydomyces testavorans]